MFFAVWEKKKIKIFVCVLLVIIISLLVFNIPTIGYVFSKNKRELPIYRVKREDKKISISFDCAWGVDYTDKLLSIMSSEDIKCTFFCVEFWTTKYPEYIKKIASLGHEIGTHTATHPYMSKLSKDKIQSELSTSKQKIEKLTNKKVQVFRPPYGDYNDLVINTAREMGLYTIQWDVDSLDWKDLTKEQIYNRVISKVKSGSIVLFHNQGLNTADALKDIIKTLKNDGFSFVTISELIYHENFYINSNGEQVLYS